MHDHIQILSGDCYMILDPHGSHLPAQLESVHGNLVNAEDEHFIDAAKNALAS